MNPRNAPHEEMKDLHTKMVTFDGHHNLTEADIVIIRWLSLGKRRYEIAQLISPTMTKNAVDQKVWNIMNKLGTSTSAGVVGIALRKGYIK